LINPAKLEYIRFQQVYPRMKSKNPVREGYQHAKHSAKSVSNL
jgi:hypothetical protein